MKLTNITSGVILTLPNDLLWADEFSWSPVVSSNSFSLSGALIIEQGVKAAGRPISLKSAQSDMGWVLRSTGLVLQAWAALPSRVFKLKFEYPTDVREFDVVFDTSGAPLELSPVKEFPAHTATDWFVVESLKFIGVTA